MEQQAIYDGIKVTTGSAAIGVATDGTKMIWYEQIPGILCPSEVIRRWNLAAGSNGNTGINSYMFSSGDWPDAHCYFLGANTARREAKDISSGGTYVRNPRGIFVCWGGNWRGTEGVTDGTSNTLAMAEKTVGESIVSSGASLKIASASNRSTAVAGNTADPSTATATPDVCNGSTVRDGNNYKADVSLMVERGGCRWADGISTHSTFSAILPPNSPHCLTGDMNSRVLASPSSYHSGGANTLRFDASVHFVSDTVNCGTLSSVPVRSGASPYGVWGAMGSIDGGESTAL
jgi:hypothetical protein